MMEKVEALHWLSLCFVASAVSDDHADFYEKFQKFHGVDVDKILDKVTAATPKEGAQLSHKLIEYTGGYS